MLSIEAISALEPMSTFAPSQVHELLDYCHLEQIDDGKDPFSVAGASSLAMYLLKGRLELAFSDGNRLAITAGSEWSKLPLGRHQPLITTATAIGDVGLLCVNNDLLHIMEVRNLHAEKKDDALKMSQQGSADDGHSNSISGANLINSDMNSMRHFKLWPFMQLSPEHLEELLQLVELFVAWDGEEIIREGEAGDYYYLLEKGRAEVSRQVGGATMVLAELEPGDAFGEEALISGARRNATITMRSNGLLLRLKQNDFLKLVQQPLLHHVNFAAAEGLVADGAMWVDVRHPPEFRRDKLSGAINVPLNDIRSAIGVLDDGCKYIVYCHDGRRSAVAAFILARAGYDVSVLDGGLDKDRKSDSN